MPALTTEDILLRLGLTLVAGLTIGYEREGHGRPAGLRTTMLVGVAAALAMMLSQGLVANWPGNMMRPDPARLAAGVLTGMGFLGAGSILRHENLIRGLTTAAVLWLNTILGLAFGSGQYGLGLAGLGIALLALFVLPYLEDRIDKDFYADVIVTVAANGPSEDEIRQRLEACGVTPQRWELRHDLALRQRVVRCEIKLQYSRRFTLSAQVVRQLAECPGVLAVEWQ